MFAKENMLRIAAKFIAYFFSPKNMHEMYLFFLQSAERSSVIFDTRVIFAVNVVVLQAVDNAFSRVWCRRSLCASAFYKKGPARGAKRGAYTSLSIEKKVFPSDEISLDRSYVRFGRIACRADMRGANIIGVARDGVSGAPRRRWVCGPTSGSRCAL